MTIHERLSERATFLAILDRIRADREDPTVALGAERAILMAELDDLELTERKYITHE
jgi:hypothetical protein